MADAPIEPDSLSGVVFALEGFEGVTVLLNGPTGCKYYHAALSDSQTLRRTLFDPMRFPMSWYFGQPRVPCTFLDNADYVYGSEAKLADALEGLRGIPELELLCIVNTPGAALIGDDLDGIVRRHGGGTPCMCVETPGFSEGMCAGHERALCALVDHVVPLQPDGVAASSEVIPHSVNVLGLSLYQRHHVGDVTELRRMVEAMGLTVECMLGAGCTLQELSNIGRAALNVVVYPELGLQTARFLQQRFGTPFYVCSAPPVGFEATERFARDLARLAGGDAGPIEAECREARKRAFSFLSRVNSTTGLPRGVPFAVEGMYSELRAYVEFLVDYLALMPVSLTPAFPQADCARDGLLDALRERGFADCLGAEAEQAEPELFFGSGSTIGLLRLAGVRCTGVETMLPTLGYLDVVPKTHLGPVGALRVVEAVLNGLIY